MKTKSRLLLIVTIMLLGLTTATIVNISLNFRKYSIDSEVDKAKMAANMVKDGLTSHMVNGIMDKRQYFLNRISGNRDVEFLRVVRAQKVIDQYGEGLNGEIPIDDIDIKVLQTGKMIQKITENADKTILRVTIPYNATVDNSNASCLNCHTVKKGDVLGAISMQFDISHMRNNGMFTILKIIGINLLFIFIVLILINYYVTPYMNLFSNLRSGIKKAYKGDFTHKFNSSVGGEAKDVVEQMNSLFSKMQITFGDIKHNLSTFIPSGIYSGDPLNEANIIINELSDIYKFKKTIELDDTKNSVFLRIADILKLKFNLENFSIYEINNVKGTRNLVFNKGENSICFKSVDKNVNTCRAHRNKTDVISSEFVNLCQTCEAHDLNYICIPFTINDEHSLTLSILANEKSKIKNIQNLIPSLKNYLEAAKPVIESRILMDALRDTSLRDAMTGLYNRRFLEEVIDKIMSQSGRNKDTYSVMMLDVDWFKSVNDTYGHDIGDMVIVEIGKVLKEHIREADLAIRYGGEEFVVILHNSSKDGALEVAHKIHQAFGALIFNVGAGETMQKTMSIGISYYPTDGDSIWKCIKLADTALYVAKTTGRNKIVEYTLEMSENGELR